MACTPMQTTNPVVPVADKPTRNMGPRGVVSCILFLHARRFIKMVETGREHLFRGATHHPSAPHNLALSLRGPGPLGPFLLGNFPPGGAATRTLRPGEVPPGEFPWGVPRRVSPPPKGPPREASASKLPAPRTRRPLRGPCPGSPREGWAREGGDPGHGGVLAAAGATGRNIPREKLRVYPSRYIHGLHAAGHTDQASPWGTFPETGVPPVGSFWECSFPGLRPRRRRGGLPTVSEFGE